MRRLNPHPPTAFWGKGGLRSTRWRLTLATAAFVSAAALLPASPAEAAGKIRWLDKCPVGASAETRCGELEVLERRDRPKGRTIVVPIAIVPAPDQAKKAADPFLFLMGGTGAGFEVLREVSVLPAILNRDVIVVEQRGNPMARPFFGCENVPPANRLHIIYNTSIEYSGPSSVAACKATLRTKNIDLNAYLTPSAAEDLIDLRHALGLTAWNVYGVSYGGRVGTTLLRKDPSAVRSLILDSAQITGSYFSIWERLRAIGNFFDRCAAAAGCGTQFPRLRESFEATIARLAAEPHAITVAGAPDRLSASDYIHLVAWSLYQAGLDTASRVPAAVMAAGRDDYRLLLGMNGFYADRGPSFYPPNIGYNPKAGHNAQQISMLCAEEFPYRQSNAEMNDVSRNDWKVGTVRVARTIEQLERKVCREWAFAPADPAQARAPTGKAPTLILYGEHDTIALPEHGRIAENSLNNAKLYVFPWTGHAVIEQRQVCALGMIAAFVANPAGKLDGSCASAIPEPAWLPNDGGRGDDMALVRAHAANAVAKFGLPGRGVYVMAPTIGVEGVAASGRRDAKIDAALTGNETFRIASQTKTFTAAAVLRLVEQGVLQVDQTVADLISPDLEQALRDGGHDPSQITVRQLLNHTSGLPDYAMDPDYQSAVVAEPSKRWTRAEQVRWGAVRLKPTSRPGERFIYSDTGYILLGDLIERATKLPQAQAFRTLLNYERLGLRHTWFETLEAAPPAAPPRARQYIDGTDVTEIDPSFDLYGGGGLMSTLQDQASFLAALFGGRVFERPETLRLMQEMSATNRTTSSGDGYGLGIARITVDGVECWGHSGYFGSSAYHCPAPNLTVSASRYTASEPPAYQATATLNTALLMQRLRTQAADRE